MSDGLVCGWCGQDPCEDTCAWHLQDQLTAEREANKGLREAAEAVVAVNADYQRELAEPFGIDSSELLYGAIDALSAALEVQE